MLQLMLSLDDNAKRARRFRFCAEEVRVIAGQVKRERTRELLHGVALDCDRMADELEAFAPESAMIQDGRFVPSTEH